MKGNAFPSVISDKLILPSQLKCLEMSCQCVNIVQGDVNTVFRHLANPGSFKACPGKLYTFRKDSRGDRDFMLSPSGRIPGIKGLSILNNQPNAKTH